MEVAKIMAIGEGVGEGEDSEVEEWHAHVAAPNETAGDDSRVFYYAFSVLIPVTGRGSSSSGSHML